MNSVRTLVVLALACLLLASVADAVASAGSCSSERRCSDDSDCDTSRSDRCCNGRCVANDQFDLNLGSLCDDNGDDCRGKCRSSLACRSQRCERWRGLAGPGCICDNSLTSGCSNPYTYCDFMANRTVVENRCVWNNLPPGAPCDTNAQCRGNCENNVCVTTSTSGSSCASAFDGTCPNSLACVVEEAPPSVARQCLSRRPVNGYCRDPSDCISGVCDTDSNLCIAALQLEGGANCTDNYACKSGLCAVGTLGYRTCIDRPYSGGQGSPCPFGHTQCQMGYKCVGSPTVARCMNVRGLQCVSSTICGPNAECKCTGGTHYACQAADKPSLNCLTERVEYRKFTGSIFASLVRPWHLYPTDVAEAAAKLLCCEYRRGSFNNNEVKNRYLRGDGQVQPGARLNCRVDPPTWEERKTGDYPERCSLTSEVAFDNIWLL